MSPLPTQMINRWRNRQEPGPGQGTVYWHILVGDHPGVRELAQAAQKRLAGFSGLHMTPIEWLHITILVAGPDDEITADRQQAMLAAASSLLADIPPVKITLGRVFYHPEAIALIAYPTDTLKKVRKAVQKATREVTGREESSQQSSTWSPHVTIAYSEAEQPAQPIISALGRELPSREITLSAVSLVVQRGKERLWDWHPVGQVHLVGH